MKVAIKKRNVNTKNIQMIITKMCDFIKRHRPVLDLKKSILHLMNLVYDLGALNTEINISKYINL